MGQMKLEKWDLVGAFPKCNACGAASVVRDAWAEWNIASNSWELKSTFDTFACNKCSEIINPIWELDEAYRKSRIRRLNDALRQGNGENGSVVISQGVQALGAEVLKQVVLQVAGFKDFSEDNDPHEEHDFGCVTIDGQKLFWKVDYFDLRLKYMSPDPASCKHTTRVLTVMLASEY